MPRKSDYSKLKDWYYAELNERKRNNIKPNGIKNDTTPSQNWYYEKNKSSSENGRTQSQKDDKPDFLKTSLTF